MFNLFDPQPIAQAKNVRIEDGRFYCELEPAEGRTYQEMIDAIDEVNHLLNCPIEEFFDHFSSTHSSNR